MNILPFRGVLPDLNAIPDQARFFGAVKEEYPLFRDRGYFQPSGAPAFYVFRMENAQQRATGLICTTDIREYLQGKIRKHERTIRSKELIQVRLLQSRQAAVKPVLLVHQHQPGIRRWLHDYAAKQPPILTVHLGEGETHTLWEVSRPAAIEELRQLYRSQLETVAIADGHHRLSAFATLARQAGDLPSLPFESVLTAYFPEDELKIEAFHRLVHLPDPKQRTELWQRLRDSGTLHPLPAARLPERKHQMSIVSDGQWYTFEWAPGLLTAESEQHPVLDVVLLQERLLIPLLKDLDVQHDSRIHYLEHVDTPRQLTPLLATHPKGICFVLYPILPEDFLQATLMDLTLTPKATFFQPRLQNGLIVQSLTQNTTI